MNNPDTEANIDAFARAIYKAQCDYFGADHEGHCVEQLKIALQSTEDKIESLTAQNEAYDRALEVLSSGWAYVHDMHGFAKTQRKRISELQGEG